MDRSRRAWTAALMLLCVVCLLVQFRHIKSTLPYPLDIDEGFVSGPANRMLVTGTLHPYTFIYPSLPKYLAAIGMAGGFLRSAGRLEVREINRLGSVGFPYYDVPGTMQGARQLFALLAILALAATGVSAWHAFQKPAAIVLAPFALWMTPLFFHHSWAYLNVDIVATCFVMLALAACLQGTRRPSMGQSAILPGALAGFATGSKYTLAVAIVPIVLAIVLYGRPGRRLTACLAAVAAMVLAFLLAVPFSLIDIPGFLNGLAQEAYHYARGHAGNDGEPGLPQIVFYGRHLISEFGIGGVIVAVIGGCAFAVTDWRRAAVLFAFPAALLWLLASQRVHFTRNVLSLQPIVALLLAYGVVALQGVLVRFADRRGWGAAKSRRTQVLASLLMVAVAVPVWRIYGQVRDHSDSRNLAQAWIEERIPAGWTIVVPTEMRFDPRGLQAHGRHVTEVDFRPAQTEASFHQLTAAVHGPAVIMVPQWEGDSRFPGGEDAQTLNEVSRHLRVLKTFGTNPVLINYNQPVPNGDPAFAVAVPDLSRFNDGEDVVTHPIRGLHHVTATVDDAQDDLDFCLGALGLRLVKKTVNFDNHHVYHFYYGDERGTPGTIWTTFPYSGRDVAVGRKGAGQITSTALSVPAGSLSFWRAHLGKRGFAVNDVEDRFGDAAIACADPSGLEIELVAARHDSREPWVSEGIDADVAVRGLHSVTMLVRSTAGTLDLMTRVLGYKVVDESENRTRVGVHGGGPGKAIDIVLDPKADTAVNGLGTVHHVAMAVPSVDDQLRLRQELIDYGCKVTEVRDRCYFTSIYFREPGGVLFEIATNGPGFLIDEAADTLGRDLKLPPWEEPNRAMIEAGLAPVTY